MRVNGEAIHGTTASPFDFDFPWGSMTQKGNRLYLHVLKWNPEGIRFNGLVSKPTGARLLADPDRKELGIHQADGITTVEVPTEAPDPNVSVIVLEFDGPIKIDRTATGKYHWTKGAGLKLQGKPKRKSRKK